MSSVSVQNLSIRYFGFEPGEILSRIEFSLAKNECLLVTGLSGCGKSSLLYALGNIFSDRLQTDGFIRIAGKTPREAVEAGLIGWLHQNPTVQLFNTTVEEELAFSLQDKNLTSKQIHKKIDDWLSILHLEAFKKRRITELSSGEKQKVALAAAAVREPRLLLLDEPTAFLDLDSGKEIFALLKALKQNGVTMILVEHQPEALELADKVLILQDGEVFKISAQPRGEFATLCQLGIFNSDPQSTPMNAFSPTEIELSTEDLSFKYYGQPPLFQNLNLTILKNRLNIIQGPVGCGKTTLLKVLSGTSAPNGFYRPSAGKIYHQNRLTSAKDRRKLAFYLAPLSKELFLNERVSEEVTFGAKNYRILDQKKLNYYIKAFELETIWDRTCHTLSFGQQQRVALASAFMLPHPIILLDEPTLGQDWFHLKKYLDFIFEVILADKTVIMATHNQSLARTYAANIIKL